MAYAFLWLIYTAYHDQAPQPWGTYLTNWTYSLLTIYLTLHFLTAFYEHVRCGCLGQGRTCYASLGRASVEKHVSMFVEPAAAGSVPSENFECGTDDNSRDKFVEVPTEPPLAAAVGRPPWYLCVVWALFSTVSTSAVMVTILFFAYVFPTMKNATMTSADTLQLHLFNSVIIIAEQMLTAIPCRLLHIIYPLIYGIIYVLFSLLYWAVDHNNVVYSVLNWNNPGKTIGFAIFVFAVFTPSVHIFFFFVSRLKMYIFHYVYQAELNQNWH